MSPAYENEVWCGVKFGKLLLYDLEREEVTQQLNRAHVINCYNEGYLSLCDTFDVNAVCKTSDPNLIATGGDEGFIKLWDRRVFGQSQKPVGGFIGHYEGVVSLDTPSDTSIN